MHRYNEFRQRVGGTNIDLSNMMPLQEQDIVRLVSEVGGYLPDEYTDFLREIGWGPIEEISLMIYDGLVGPRSIFGEDAPSVYGQILIFGDNYSGYCYGFVPSNNWRIVMIGPTQRDVCEEATTFEEFVWEKCT